MIYQTLELLCAYVGTYEFDRTVIVSMRFATPLLPEKLGSPYLGAPSLLKNFKVAAPTDPPQPPRTRENLYIPS